MEKRPRCPQCDKRLRPYWETVKSERIDRPHGGHEYQNHVEWRGGYHAYGAFDTMHCAVDFANAAYKAGYRLKRRST